MGSVWFMLLLERKLIAERIADLYQEIGYLNYASRIRDCARFVRYVEKTFWIAEYDYDGSGEVIDVHESDPQLRLVDGIFCRVRHCPICQWRKSKRWQALALKSFPKIRDDYPDHRWLFLTLTVKNCKLSRLHSKVKTLNQSFLKWVKWKSFPAVGWIKSLEVTLNESDPTRCHPHFHVLLMVSGQYFSDHEMYLTQPEWVDAWRKAAKLTYRPVVDIRSVRSGCEEKFVPELLKYGVKPDDLAGVTSEQLKLLTQQLHGVHAINKGGLLRDCFKDVGSDDVDLIGSSDDEGMPTGYEYYNRWDKNVKGYEELVFNKKRLKAVLMLTEDKLQDLEEGTLYYDLPEAEQVSLFS